MNTSIQNKRNIKYRTSKFINSLKNEITDVPFNFKYTGSIKKPEPMKINKEGFFDIDIDIIVSTKSNANEIYKKFSKAIKKHTREHEKTRSKTNAVIHVYVDNKEIKYNFDFAIFNVKGISPNQKPKKMIKEKTGYV